MRALILAVLGLLLAVPAAALDATTQKYPPLRSKQLTTDALQLGGAVTCTSAPCDVSGLSAVAPGGGSARGLGDWLKATGFNVPTVTALRSWPIAPP